MYRLIRARQRGDEGVIALLTALIVAGVLIPVTALALTSYTRSGVKAEYQRAADSGALNGAASIGLLDINSLPVLGSSSEFTLVELQDFALGIQIPPPTDPFGRACAAAAIALQGDGSPGSDKDTAPLSTAFSNLIGCRAEYADDFGLVGCLGALGNVIDGVLGPNIDVLEGLLSNQGLLGALGLPLGEVTDLLGVQSVVTNLLPALARSGVVVELTYALEDIPLEGILLRDDEDIAERTFTVTATADRTFQSLLPNFATLGDDLDPLAPGLTDLLNEVGGGLTPVEQLVVTQVQAVITILRAVVSGISTAQAEALLLPLVDSIDTQLIEALGLEDIDLGDGGGGGLLGGLGGTLGLGDLLGDLGLDDLLDDLGLGGITDLTELITGTDPDFTSIGGVTDTCIAALDDVLVDLQNALTVNEDPEYQDLTPCLVGYLGSIPVLANPFEVLGGGLGGITQIAPTGVLVDTQDCVNKVFRARLVDP